MEPPSKRVKLDTSQQTLQAFHGKDLADLTSDALNHDCSAHLARKILNDLALLIQVCLLYFLRKVTLYSLPKLLKLILYDRIT